MLDFARFLTHLNLIFQESTKNIKLVIEQLGPSDVWRDLQKGTIFLSFKEIYIE